MALGGDLPKKSNKHAQYSGRPIHVSAWDCMYVEDGVLHACFSSGREQFVLTLGPGTTTKGIALATQALMRGGILPPPKVVPFKR